jgi:TDG/mug DNA glycosylase family protein
VEHLKTLPDYLRPGLAMVSIGINPSLYSVEKGFAFARPGNRFWPAFNAAGFVPVPLEPGRAAVETLFREHGIGFTDIVKRPTRTAAELSENDYAEGARRLLAKLRRYQPRIAWFQGKSAWQMFLLHCPAVGAPRLEGRSRAAPRVDHGPQAETIGDTRVFVTPNPSGANPAANPKALLAHFTALRQFRDGMPLI